MRTVRTLIYREYLDPNCLLPKPDKLVLVDVNEPVHQRARTGEGKQS
jgi:hypothetical protein